ncbi:MAG: ubiquitin-activating E1 FCCH domain-containing protein [Bacteroidota bacterium]
MAKLSGKDGIVLYGTIKAITAATGTTTITVTTGLIAHGFSVKDRIQISGVVGMTDLNGSHTIDTVPLATTFTVILSKATSQTYTSGGSVYVCTDIVNWSVDAKAEVVDTTDSSTSAWKTFIPNNWKEANGTFDGFFYTGTTKPTIGTSLVIRLMLDSNNYYHGNGYITSDGTSVAVVGTDAVKVTYAFTITGTLSLTVA